MYRPSLRVTAKRVLLRTFPVVSTVRKVLTEKAATAKYLARRRRLRRYRLKTTGRHLLLNTTAKTAMIRHRVQLRPQRNQRKKNTPLTVSHRRLFKLISKVHDRRKKHKRGRSSKHPGFKRGIGQLVLARQLVRKLRSVQRTATRTLRRRVLRSKRRHYRKPRTRFNTVHYLRRLRVKRRTARRVQRHIRSTATILRGARTRILHRRAISRDRRTTYFQLSRQNRLLLSSPSLKGLQQVRRQQLLTHRERRRRIQAIRLLANRAVRPTQPAASRN